MKRFDCLTNNRHVRITDICHVSPCNKTDRYQDSGRRYYLHRQVRPWRWTQHVPLKRWYAYFIAYRGVTLLRTVILKFSTARTRNLQCLHSYPVLISSGYSHSTMPPKTRLLTRKAMYIYRNIEVRSYNHWCGGKNKIKYYLFWLCICNLRYPAGNAQAPCYRLWSARLYNIFPPHFIKDTLFEKKKWLNIKRVF